MRLHSYAVFKSPLHFLGHLFLNLLVVLKSTSTLTGTFLTGNVSELFWSSYISLVLVLKCGLLTNLPKTSFAGFWQLPWAVKHLSMNIMFIDHVVVCPVWGWIQWIQSALLSEEKVFHWLPCLEGDPWFCGFILVVLLKFVLYPPPPQAATGLWAWNCPEALLQSTIASYLWWFLVNPLEYTTCESLSVSWFKDNTQGEWSGAWSSGSPTFHVPRTTEPMPLDAQVHCWRSNVCRASVIQMSHWTHYSPSAWI